MFNLRKESSKYDRGIEQDKTNLESGRSECAKHQSKKECNMLEKLKEDYVSGLGYNQTCPKRA